MTRTWPMADPIWLDEYGSGSWGTAAVVPRAKRWVSSLERQHTCRPTKLRARHTSYDARRVAGDMPARFERNGHLDLLIELAEDRNHAVKSEAAKLRVANTRKFRVRNAGELFRVPRREFAFVEHPNDFRGRNGACLLKASIGPAKIAIDIAAAANQLEVILSRFSTSFNRLRRSMIKSTSICGVLIPFLDFFWNA
jgi:hypothetical protein